MESVRADLGEESVRPEGFARDEKRLEEMETESIGCASNSKQTQWSGEDSGVRAESFRVGGIALMMLLII